MTNHEDPSGRQRDRRDLRRPAECCAARAWRETALHRAFQAQGRAGIFDDYRLRVAAVVRDYGLHERAEAPGDSRRAHG
jgi:hypothetical protein